jgi:methanethiol S-methyltransferase
MEVLESDAGSCVARIGSRAIGIVCGLGAQILFAWTVWRLFLFFRESPPAEVNAFVLRDGLLALQFGVIHSLLLLPAVRSRLSRWVPAAFYGCFFCIVTCADLLLLIQSWAVSPDVVYEVRGTAGVAAQCAFDGSWLALVYSLHLTGLGYQTGWTPWWHWFRNQPQPKRTFQEREVYCIFRHPIYLCFLGIIWFTPRMTLDHALLTGLWTVYIFFGSYLKDERLAYYLGTTYRDYQERVPGYPLIGIGPLGRRRRACAPRLVNQAVTHEASATRRAA